MTSSSKIQNRVLAWEMWIWKPSQDFQNKRAVQFCQMNQMYFWCLICGLSGVSCATWDIFDICFELQAKPEDEVQKNIVSTLFYLGRFPVFLQSSEGPRVETNRLHTCSIKTVILPKFTLCGSLRWGGDKHCLWNRVYPWPEWGMTAFFSSQRLSADKCL